MSSPKKVKLCVVTGTRAEYGLLSGLVRAIRDDDRSELQLVVTGTHLSPRYGETVKEIVRDGFAIAARVEILSGDDSDLGVAESIAKATHGLAKAFHDLAPDFVVLLGDRFEILAAAQAALVSRIPVVHINGGDLTEGAFDDSIRHSVTKMAHVHFVTHAAAARRVKQLGEDPQSVHIVGHLGAAQIQTAKLLSASEFTKKFHFQFCPTNLLITFHPVTLDQTPSVDQFRELLAALDLIQRKLSGKLGILFTHPNADNGREEIMGLLESYLARTPQALAFPSLGLEGYLSAVKLCDAVVGNSSSGIYEVPFLARPTVNIGDRQKGRPQPSSVFQTASERSAIVDGITHALAWSPVGMENPYATDVDAPQAILEVIHRIQEPRKLLKKVFFDCKESV